GIFKNLFTQLIASPTLPSFHKLSSATYPDFTERNQFAVVLFDAPWDVGGAKAILPSMESAFLKYGDQVQFGEVNIDEHQDVAASVRLLNVPAIAYYRRGEL